LSAHTVRPTLRLIRPAHAQTLAERAVAGRLLREPLLHFLLIAVLIYAVSAAFGRDQSDKKNRIRVSAAEINRLKDLWAAQWGHPPNSSELQNLIADAVREEILYREAIASGLDREDSIIRRRLVQKMEFLIQDPSLVGEPTEKELTAWFEQHREKYAAPAAFSFSHVFFSRSLHNAAAVGDARRALDLLRQHHAGVKGLSAGSWQGPIESMYGAHLVWVSQQQPGNFPTLDAARSRVLSDVMNERMHRADERAMDELRSHYQVNIDRAALAPASSK